MKLQPLNDRVIVKREDVEEKVGSFYIPNTAQEKPNWGTVVAVGPGHRDESASRISDSARLPLSVKVGDHVLFGKYSGVEFKKDGEEYVALKEEDIIAKDQLS